MARILVIDDEIQMREMLQQMLERAGHEAVTVSSGDAGVKCYRQERTDVVVIDIHMPGKDGLEVIQELRHDFPDVKIIAISGRGGTGKLDILAQAKMLGVQRSLRKPFHKQYLLNAVKELSKERL